MEIQHRSVGSQRLPFLLLSPPAILPVPPCRCVGGLGRPHTTCRCCLRDPPGKRTFRAALLHVRRQRTHRVHESFDIGVQPGVRSIDV